MIKAHLKMAGVAIWPRFFASFEGNANAVIAKLLMSTSMYPHSR